MYYTLCSYNKVRSRKTVKEIVKRENTVTVVFCIYRKKTHV